jgi:PEP-CTERM motif
MSYGGPPLIITRFTHFGLSGGSFVPEPASVVLLGMGGLGLIGFIRRQKKTSER